MSVNKITELLQNHSMIDFNLISDSLSSILSEMCQIITNQGEEIDSIKKQLATFSVKTEVDQKFKMQTDACTNLQNGLNNLCQITQQKLEVLAQMIQENSENAEQQISDLKHELETDSMQQIKDIQGNIFIKEKQIKELEKSIKENKSLIDDNMKEVKGIREFINKGEDQTIEVVSAKVEELIEKVKKLNGESSNDRTSIHKDIESIKENLGDFQGGTRKEIENLTKDLRAVRSIVVDTPLIDFEGTVDTEVVVRAIQRDSRRIDSFNETINSLRDENNLIKLIFVEMGNCIQKIQLNFLDFVSEHNKTKKDLFALNSDNAQRCKLLKSNFFNCSLNIQSLLETYLSGMNLIANSFNQVYSFLGKITTKPLPMFKDFDDALLDVQRLSDRVTAENEKNEELNQTEEKKSPRNFSEDPFKMTPVQMPDFSQLISQSSASISRFDSMRRREEAVKMASSGIDVELRQDVQEIKSKIDESFETVTHLRDTIESKIENKADTASMERMMDKIRGMISKLKDQISSQNKSLSGCVQRGEAESLVLHILAANGQTAAGANHLECLMCGRPKSSITSSAPGANGYGGNLPRLSSSIASSQNNPYELIYGKSFSGMASPEKRHASYTCTEKSRTPFKGDINMSLKGQGKGYQFKNT